MGRKGFTLIELLIVVVIIGILAAIAIPRFAESRERAFVSAMQSDINQLRQAQEMYFNDSPPLNEGDYTYGVEADLIGDAAVVPVSLSPGVSVSELTVSDSGNGWSVVLEHANTTVECYYFFGDAAAVGDLDDDQVGQIQCREPAGG